jgi:hypothetical protein
MRTSTHAGRVLHTGVEDQGNDEAVQTQHLGDCGRAREHACVADGLRSTHK